jgi:hypothetical protein
MLPYLSDIHQIPGLLGRLSAQSVRAATKFERLLTVPAGKSSD